MESHYLSKRTREKKARQITIILQGFNQYITISPEVTLPNGIYELLESSCFVPVISAYLRNDSLLDIMKEQTVYTNLFQVISTVANHSNLIELFDTLSDQTTSILDLLLKLTGMAEVILKRTPAEKPEEEDDVKAEKEKKEQEDSIALATNITKTAKLIKEKLDNHRAIKAKKEKDDLRKEKAKQPVDDGNAVSTALEAKYKEALKSLQFGEKSMKEKGEYVHHYKTKIAAEKIGMGPKLKRLIQEVGSLSSGMPLYVDSSVFLRVDSERIDVMQALITGPVDTPYENGCFQFDIYCPAEYPKGPPVVNLETTGGGTVRFNPNLYNCGKVCLSLLGTWSGGENEKWNEKTSTLLQVLVSIQSLILVEEPYFNEPGYEREMGTDAGNDHSREYNEVIRVGTVRWAMVEQLRNPSPGFDEVIRTHFKIKRLEVWKQVSRWLKEAVGSKTGHLEKLRPVVEDLKKELIKLDPAPLEEPAENDAEKKKKEEEKLKKDITRWVAAAELLNFVPNYPLALVVKGLEINQDKSDETVNWLFEHGETYVLDHPELLTLTNPLTTDISAKK